MAAVVEAVHEQESTLGGVVGLTRNLFAFQKLVGLA